MSEENLSPAEKNSIKWQMFSEVMDRLVDLYDDGDICAYDVWELAKEKYDLFS